MDIFITLFNEIFYRPLFNALIFLYNIIPGRDFGVAIILVTLIIKIVLSPISRKGIKSQEALKKLQPKIKEIQRKYKDKKEEQAKHMMNLYKEHKVNPVAGCLPLLLQFPILIALYRALIGILKNSKTLTSVLYPFVRSPDQVNTFFFKAIDLAVPSVFLAVLTGIFQFIQGKMMFKLSSSKSDKSDRKIDIQKTMGRQMIYFMPLFIVFISLRLPAGLPLYWAVSTLFSIGEYALIKRKKTFNKHEDKRSDQKDDRGIA